MKKLFFMSLLGLGVFSNQATYTKDIYTINQKDLSYYNTYDLTQLGHKLAQEAKAELVVFKQTIRNIANSLLLANDVNQLKQLGLNIYDLEKFKKSFQKIKQIPQEAEKLIANLNNALKKSNTYSLNELKTLLKQFSMEFKKLHDLLYN